MRKLCARDSHRVAGQRIPSKATAAEQDARVTFVSRGGGTLKRSFYRLDRYRAISVAHGARRPNGPRDGADGNDGIAGENEILTRVPLCWCLCIISWNSSSILVYLASVRGVKLYSIASGSGLSGDMAPLCSFLLSACKCQQTGSRDHTARGHSTFACTLISR